MNDWAEIRHLSRVEGLSGRAIARRLGISTNTVVKALASSAPPKYVRAPKGSKVDSFVPAILGLLRKDPRLRATVIAERVGFPGDPSSSTFRARVRELKQQIGVADPVDRLVFSPGEQVQCDLWFPAIPVEQTGMAHPVLTMIACWSRFLLAVMIPSRQCGDILAGMNLLLTRLGGLPDHLLWDNESGIVSKRRLIPQASGWAGSMGASIRLAKPYDPETKGRIERANGYLGTSFEPARRFASINDFNTQLDQWLDQKANQRRVRTLNATPADLIDDERLGLTPLPGVMPPARIEYQVRLSRDYHVRVAGSDYSIDPVAIGRIVTIQASLDRVTATCATRIVADHARCHQPHQTITDPAHVARAADLRRHYQHQSSRREPPRHIHVVEDRDLGFYDQLWKQEAR